MEQESCNTINTRQMKLPSGPNEELKKYTIDMNITPARQDTAKVNIRCSGSNPLKMQRAKTITADHINATGYMMLALLAQKEKTPFPLRLFMG